MGVVSVGTSAVMNGIALFGYAALYVYVAPWQLPATAWYTWVIAILGVDLLYYWYHRMAHRVRLFWATHQAHHSSQYFNFATALRQKWNISGDVFLRALLPLFGVPPWIVFASFSINLIYQFWIHTERIGKLWRPIEFIFNTPSHHRVHHGMDEQYLDKNYGGILIVWDRLFGSFQPETFRPHYGLTKQVDTYNIWKLQTHEYVAIARDVRAAHRWRDRLGFIFGPPGWEPRQSVQPDIPAPITVSEVAPFVAVLARMDVTEVKLPGVGLRYEFDIAHGRPASASSRGRSGDFEFVLYAPRRSRPGPAGLPAHRGRGRGARPDPRCATHRGAVRRPHPRGARPARPARSRSDRTVRSSTGRSATPGPHPHRRVDRRDRPRRGSARLAGPAEMLHERRLVVIGTEEGIAGSSASSTRAEPWQISAALLLELGVILTVLTVLGTARAPFALSPIPLYLVAGLALGDGGIAPVRQRGIRRTGASIGVVLLLLTLGLEFSIARVRQQPAQAPAVGVGRRRPQRDAGRGRGLAARARTVSGSSPWPASPTSRRPVSSRACSTTCGRLGNRETPAVLSMLVLEDFAMAAYLPLLAVLAAGGIVAGTRCSAWRSPSPR